MWAIRKSAQFLLYSTGKEVSLLRSHCGSLGSVLSVHNVVHYRKFTQLSICGQQARKSAQLSWCGPLGSLPSFNDVEFRNCSLKTNKYTSIVLEVSSVIRMMLTYQYIDFINMLTILTYTNLY